jgi:uncharacterized protein (TIGR01319 family)
MPTLGELQIEPARGAILKAFLEHVIGGKGLSRSREFERMVKMPTPEAVLEATRLLARGTARVEGVGDLLVVDIGGATTDVHSDRASQPAAPGIEDPLLPPPPTLRTVEGDLGLRAGAAGAIAADARWIAAESHLDPPALGHSVTKRAENPSWIPEEGGDVLLDGLLARSCARNAIARHCGTMRLTPGQAGPPTLVRDGADLREVCQVLGTGGVFAHRPDADGILRDALRRRLPHSLAPSAPAISVDRSYVLAAGGLLATLDPDGAVQLMRRELSLAKN